MRQWSFLQMKNISTNVITFPAPYQNTTQHYLCSCFFTNFLKIIEFLLHDAQQIWPAFPYENPTALNLLGFLFINTMQQMDGHRLQTNGQQSFCNFCSSFYLSQTHKPSLQKLYPGEVGVLCSGHVNHQSVPREHHLQGQDQPVDGSSEMKPFRVNSNYSVESIEQWNLVRVLTWCPRRHHSAPPASSPKCWCISPLSGSCVQSGIKITEWARCWRDRHVPTFLYHCASVRFTGKHGNY